ncbi:hypothetical protein ONZ45_g6881 [Pleurotus djamor]|nr:hypothetical protein ONZ45_g6881 [Pleurotus djamor]
MARKPRNAEKAQPLYADTDEEFTEPEESPSRPSGSRHLKKRISEAYLPGHDASFSLDSQGARPAVNINDDAAEKRRRRKSAKLTAEGTLGGPSSEGQNDPESRAARQKAQIASVALPAIPDVQININSASYEEWMKLATDNKINAANSWKFMLIDYFHDMSLLRNTDDNSINFQRASCTLDGCVKVWTSRVDSVGTETGKLLSNLANEGQIDEEDEEGEPGPDGEPVKKKKKTSRPEATLAKTAQQLKCKKPDLDFAVDPLFKKTCADFDEGGAQGLLMNHLSLGLGSRGALRVIFDASDSMGVEEEELAEEPVDEIDLSALRSKHLPVPRTPEAYKLPPLAFLPDADILEDKEIAPSLADFSFSKSTGFDIDTSLFQDDSQDGDDDDFAAPDRFGDGGMDLDGEAPGAEDFFQGPQAINDDYYPAEGDDYGGDNASNGSVGPEGSQGAAPYVPFDPRKVPNQRDLVMAMTEGDGEGGMMDYFDQNFNKNWAGPEHWKMRKVIRRGDADANGKTTKARREKKEAFKIDFLAPAEKSIAALTKELFAPAVGRAGINLPGHGPKKGKKKSKEGTKRDDHRLPDDMHFSSTQLVTLFLKPKFALKMRGRRVKYNQDNGEVDQNTWAQGARDGDGGEDIDQNPLPFNTQFFGDDDDGPGFGDDDGFDAGIGSFAGAEVDMDGEQDLLAATQGQSRRVKPEFVKYAKRAKRVDVKKLKENIWKGLDIVTSTTGDADQEHNMDVDDAPKPTDPTDARQFSSVISNLQRSYPPEKMRDISTSFCFICLLHLANEEGLRLESTDAPSQAEIEEDEMPSLNKQKVGDLWDLKVGHPNLLIHQPILNALAQIYRDPTATRSA